ncbi:tagatose-bisphosphate aldolase [Candidatus Shapirobacteria bacterium CG10_big_fil_rev_8_21_14_0_10_38_14]|uniref:Tagatose-bisphosphate aldolase n=1 Tax=Candidatus Shapirobacteria bacterium CG10_big_fil_rev_8_21_14_0_10_38_14 TaxID=1974483 RepID=A0A2M8L5U5_9BACT|nr:MAG: tagatose-bisphosphate aldolase [Candidatus Shapirobacteria bacterium CG10_big_fil_rev_8_21_14_0_10_38_14]
MNSAQEILEKAKNEGYALGAFNAGDLEIIQAIVQAAEGKQKPLIIETSAGEAEHFGIENFLDVVENFQQKTNLQILTNFDHGPGLEECQRVIEAGYNLVHFDGSNLPYEENVKITQALVEQAHQKGVLIEAEIDKIEGESRFSDETAESVQAIGSYTDPTKAANFVKQTGCDILAVFIGNLHGTYSTPPKLDLERLQMIHQQTPCFLSLHGGSGLLPEEIQKAIKLGVVKINVNTELRIAYKETLENVLKGSEEIAIYKIMPPVIAAVQKIVEEKIDLFNV